MSRLRIRNHPCWIQSCLGGLLLAAPVVVQAQGTPLFASAGVSDKPQSKLWHHQGFWYACINNNSKLAIYKIVGTTWVHKLDLQNAVTPVLQGGTNDVLWDGTNLFVAVFGTSTSKVYKLSYDAQADSFAVLPGFPVSLTMASGAETIVLEKDATERLWVTYEAGQKVYVRYTTSSTHLTWSSALALSGTVETDDISSIIAFGGDKVGVLWTDQRTHQVCFRVHEDADPPTTWQPTEVVRSGFGIVDDHINVKADPQGRVYFVAKDWFDAVWVGRRDLDGTWTVTTGASGLDCGTRPILQIDAATNKLYVFYTRWEQCVSTGNHKIEERVAFLDNLLFSLPTVVIGATGTVMNEVQGTKQLLPDSSLAIVCQGGSQAYWRGWGPASGIGGTDPGGLFPPPPPPPANVAAATITESSSSKLLLWRLDETSGSTASDASGNGRHGALGSGIAAPHWVPGVVGNALFFDGDDYVTVSSSALAFTGSSFTLECWFKSDLTNAPSTGMLFSKSDQLHANYQLSLKDQEFEFGWSLDDTTDITVKGTASVRDNAWHHVAAVYDAGSLRGRLFVDGSQKASKTMAAPTFGTGWPLVVGALKDGAFVDKTFSGFIDLVCVTGSAKYSSSFTPPLLYPSSSTRYARITWSAATSVAGIAGYRLRRSVNAGIPIDLNAAVTPNTWFADFAPTDGILSYFVRAVDGLTQEGSEGVAALAYESSPPALPGAPQSLASTFVTTTVDGPAWWEMNEGVGSTIADGTDRGHSGRLGDPALGDSKEPSWIYASRGPALAFDGNDYVEIADAPDLRLTGSFTVEVWVRRTAINSAHALLSKDESSSRRNYLLLIQSDNEIEFGWSTTGGSTRRVVSSTTLTDQDWHHLAGVYNASQAMNFLYLDGNLIQSGSATGTPYTGSQPVRLGARFSSSSLTDHLRGELDLARISDFARYSGSFVPPATFLGSGRKYAIQLAWSLPESGLVKDYRLYRKLLPSGSNTLIATIAYPAQSFLDIDTAQASYQYTVRARNSSNNEGPVSAPLDVTVPEPTDAVEGAVPLPPGVRLRIAPNPFNPSTTVAFRVERQGPVEAAVFDARGRRVAVLVQGLLPAGTHRVPFMGREPGARLASGVYFVRLRADGRDATAQIVLVQ